MEPSLLLQALTMAPGLVKYLNEKRLDIQDIENLDEYQQSFANSFEQSLKQELDEEITVTEIVSKFESNRDEILAALGEEHVVDVNTIVDEVTDRLTAIVLQDLDPDEYDESNVHSAVETAYLDTLDNMSVDIPEENRARLNNELNRVLQKDIAELQETLEEIQESLSEDIGPSDGHEPFRIKRKPSEFESLITEEITQRLDHDRPFQAPPDFGTHIDDQFVLIYGRKGSGKTRVLDESVRKLVGKQEFDAVIYLDRGFRTIGDLGSLLQINFEGDILLIWDDAHDIGKRDVIRDVLTRLNSHLQTVGDFELWVRMTARREALDGVLRPSHHPDSKAADTLSVDLTPGEATLSTLPVDTDHHLDEETITKLVDHALAEHEISDLEHLREDFIAAIMEYEPTPAYIESACQAIAEQEGRLTKETIESLPSSTLDFWDRAYDELRNSSPYGESRQAILKAIRLLKWIHADVFAIPVVRQLSREVFTTADNLEADLEYLKSRGWVTTHEEPPRIEIHDIRLEAIDTPTDVERVIDGFSTVLQQLATGQIDIAPEISTDYPSKLNQSFAERLSGRGDTSLAEEHFQLAARTSDATPSVHEAYAAFLYDQDRTEEARIQQQTARELRSAGGESAELRKLQKHINSQLSEWSPEDHSDTEFKSEKTQELLDPETTSTTGDFTEAIYEDRELPQPDRNPPSEAEHAEALAAYEKQILEEKIETLQELLPQHDSMSVSEDDLYTTLRREQIDVDQDTISHITRADSTTGVITDVFTTKEINKKVGKLNSARSRPRVKQPKEQCYLEVLQEELTTDSADADPTVANHLGILLEVDTGLNKWLVHLEEETTTALVNMTVEEATNLIKDELSADPFVDQLKAKLRWEYCQLIQTPGNAQDEISLLKTAATDTLIMGQTAKVYPQPSPSMPAADSTIAKRVMVTELRNATTSLEGTGNSSGVGGVVLPTGGQAHRVCLCGIVDEGHLVDDEYWWTPLQDAFGDTIVLITEEFRNRMHRDVSPEYPVMVVGRPIAFTDADGEPQVAIDIDTIANVSLETCLMSTIDVGTQTVNRIEQFATDPGMSELSRQAYDIDSKEDLEEFSEQASHFEQLT